MRSSGSVPAAGRLHQRVLRGSAHGSEAARALCGRRRCRTGSRDPRGLAGDLRGPTHPRRARGRRRASRSQARLATHAQSRDRRGLSSTAYVDDEAEMTRPGSNFAAQGRDQLWVADITYVPTWTGFLYLAVFDAWSRRVVGWAMEPPGSSCWTHSTWRSGQRCAGGSDPPFRSGLPVHVDRLRATVPGSPGSCTSMGSVCLPASSQRSSALLDASGPRPKLGSDFIEGAPSRRLVASATSHRTNSTA